MLSSKQQLEHFFISPHHTKNQNFLNTQMTIYTFLLGINCETIHFDDFLF